MESKATRREGEISFLSSIHLSASFIIITFDLKGDHIFPVIHLLLLRENKLFLI